MPGGWFEEMHMRFLIASAALCLIAFAPALAATDLSLPPFSAIDTHGGGRVVLHHGPAQKVTVIKGDLKISRVSVQNGTLTVDPCPTSCWLQSPELEVDVVSPDVHALSAHGGGSIAATGPFPTQSQLAASVHGGGLVDARAIPAENIAAEAHGGGTIKVRPLAALGASVHGGGSIIYVGNPPKIASSTHGGGSITKE